MKFFNVTFPRLLIFSLLFLWSGCIAGKVKGQPFRPVVDPYRFVSGPTFVDCGTPPVTSGLVQYLCGDTFTAAGVSLGTTLTNWPDATTFGNGIYQTNHFGAGFTVMPTLTAGPNSHAGVNMGDTTHNTTFGFSNYWFSALSGAEMIWVFKPLYAATDNGWMNLGTANANDFTFTTLAGAPHALVSDFGRASSINVGNQIWAAASTNVWRLGVYSTNNAWGIVTNGVTAWSTNVNTVAWPSSAAFYGLSLPSGYQFIGTLYSVLFYDRILTDPERVALDDWIKTKYGL